MMVKIRQLVQGEEQALESFLKNYPETSMFLRSNVYHSGVIYKADTPFHGDYFVHLNALGKIQGVLAHYWNGNLMMQCPDSTKLKALVQIFQSNCTRPIRGILGDESQAKIVIELLNIYEASFALNAFEGLYQISLSELIVPTEIISTYQLKIAKHCDPDLLKTWLTDYHIEALGADLSNSKAIESINDAIEHAKNSEALWVLEHNLIPVSLCGFNASLPDIVQIGPVWTPTNYRNQGYAKAIVMLTLNAAKKSGVKQAILFTNNPAAIRAYSSIGFKKIGSYRLAILK